MRIPLPIAVLVLLISTVFATSADATTLKCQREIAKASARYVQARSQALAKCEERVVKDSGGPCPDGKATDAIAKANGKLTASIGKACGGDDKLCGGDPTNEDLPATLGWPDRCPNLERGACAGDITDCGSIASCLVCLDDAAVDQAIGLYYDALALPSTADLNKCQVAIGKATTAFLKSKSKALQKCWDARMKGSFVGTCIEPDPGDGKYQSKIAKAEAKKREKICKACGGPDGHCDGTNDIAPATIGFPAECPAVTVPGGLACGGPITTLDSLVTCVDCVTEFKVDCPDRAQVPQLAPYPPECNVCLLPAPSGPCPTAMQFTVDGPRSDLDLGFMGFAHDAKAPDGTRLTFAVSGCAGASQPTCGECSANGPIPNAGGPAFDTHRCEDQSWVPCSSDGDCTTAGATGPCVYFFGSPQPLSGGGIPNCLMNRIAGPIAGTVDVDTGSTMLPTTLKSSVYLQGPQEQPCPICDRICLGGSDAGTACSDDAECDSNSCSTTNVCSAGPRALQACSPQGISADGAVSLDCPPSSSAATNRTFTMQLTTGIQSATLTAASPLCRQFGYTSLSCLCDTCNNANAEGCFTNADCPPSGGNPGICGGRRCIGGPNNGTPCIGPGPSECPGGACNQRGEPTQPNSCSENTTTPESGCVDVGNGEGECVDGPVDGRCSIETGLYCGSDVDCNPPPAGVCQGCASGQTCGSRARSCFTDNGIIGNSVHVTGSADVPCGGIAQPTIGGLFCAGPVGNAFVDVQGFPGLGRMKLPGDLTFVP